MPLTEPQKAASDRPHYLIVRFAGENKDALLARVRHLLHHDVSSGLLTDNVIPAGQETDAFGRPSRWDQAHLLFQITKAPDGASSGEEISPDLRRRYLTDSELHAIVTLVTQQVRQAVREELGRTLTASW
jgi:hypothetical protein